MADDDTRSGAPTRRDPSADLAPRPAQAPGPASPQAHDPASPPAAHPASPPAAHPASPPAAHPASPAAPGPAPAPGAPPEEAGTRPDVTLGFAFDQKPTASDDGNADGAVDVAARVEAAVRATETPEVRSDVDPLVGRAIEGRFEVVSRIGAGGMGVVYKARQLGMDRFVAIKVLSREVAHDEKVVRRFRIEALAVSRLTHPNTIRIFDFGRTPDGVLFFAMEYLEGRSLERSIRHDGPFPARRALHVLRQIGESLSEAHQKGIVHRDLKPDNIFLTAVGGDQDFVKVLDFGVAKLREADPRQGTMTHAGAIFGTPRYMAPEQCRSSPVDHRADLYALGVIGYEMLAGRPPFMAENPLSILIQHVQEEAPAFQAVRPDVQIPGEVEDIVRRCLEKAPDRRFQSAGELVREINRLDRGLSGRFERVVFVTPGTVPLERVTGHAAQAGGDPTQVAVDAGDPRPGSRRKRTIAAVALAMAVGV
ncbi:MAG: serine/threonine protein kinase, partial [Deltaproteobacteria bacterium]|nr:serine/threonine protein kinase [Deltaproteobacteria bacterium]